MVIADLATYTMMPMVWAIETDVELAIANEIELVSLIEHEVELCYQY